MPIKTDRRFPCPICARALDVRLTKKNKPYVTCDPCGVQMFIRGPEGIEEFNRWMQRGSDRGILERLEEMERRYRVLCPHCGSRFWIERKLVKTSSLDGSLKGFRCPKCGEVVPWEGRS